MSEILIAALITAVAITGGILISAYMSRLLVSRRMSRQGAPISAHAELEATTIHLAAASRAAVDAATGLDGAYATRVQELQEALARAYRLARRLASAIENAEQEATR